MKDQSLMHYELVPTVCKPSPLSKQISKSQDCICVVPHELRFCRYADVLNEEYGTHISSDCNYMLMVYLLVHGCFREHVSVSRIDCPLCCHLHQQIFFFAI